MLKRARTYRLAHAALARGDLDQADALFETALGGGVAGDRDVADTHTASQAGGVVEAR